VYKKDVQSLVAKLERLTNNNEWVEKTCRFNLKEARKLYSEDAFINGIIKIIKS
jgi:glycosyltransferase involved in cell wall biosynthesis